MRPGLILFLALVACAGTKEAADDSAAEECTDTDSSAWSRAYYDRWCAWAVSCAEADGKSEEEIASLRSECLAQDTVGQCADPCGAAEQACLAGFDALGDCASGDDLVPGIPDECYVIRECE